jgi:uncharacterized protein
MLIDFSVKNYLSFKNEATFSFLCESKNAAEKQKILPFGDGKYNAYAFSAVFGPNASGKSNLVKAFSDLRNLILKSHAYSKDAPIPAYKPFVLDVASVESPVAFEIEFITTGTRYTYHVEFSRTEILEETLYAYSQGKRIAKYLLFERKKEVPVKYGTAFTGEKKAFETIVLPNRLLFSVAANSNNDVLHDAYDFFLRSFEVYMKLTPESPGTSVTTMMLKNAESSKDVKELFVSFLKAADLQVNDIKLEEDKPQQELMRNIMTTIPDALPGIWQRIDVEKIFFKTKLGHPVYSNEKKTGQDVFFDLQQEESTGTNKLYDLAAVITHVLISGGVLVIDELSSGLHPVIEEFIIRLFSDKEYNKWNAQLLITSHDMHILDSGNLTREQIWLTDRDTYGASELYALEEFDKNMVRDYVRYGRHYFEGRFRGIPATAVSDFIDKLEEVSKDAKR